MSERPLQETTLRSENAHPTLSSSRSLARSLSDAAPEVLWGETRGV
jgi:hypothetical protein